MQSRITFDTQLKIAVNALSSYKNTILPLNKWLDKYEIFFYDSIE